MKITYIFKFPESGDPMKAYEMTFDPKTLIYVPKECEAFEHIGCTDLKFNQCEGCKLDPEKM